MGTVWELDFYSRPILDESGKKLWEILVCESPSEANHQAETFFRYAQYCPSTQVNSLWLQEALQNAIAQAPQPPDEIHFFRRQMTNMINKACEDLGIACEVSRRTFALNHWLQEREQVVYPGHPDFQPGVNPSVSYETRTPQPLPDALVGQQWAFVSLEASALAEMSEWEIAFTRAFPLEILKLAPDTKIPGLIIFSYRALALAGWMSGLELAFLKMDTSAAKPRLLLETGMSDRWILANLATPQLQMEAQGFEQAKAAAQQVHFLAVQSDPEAESFAGFWLLQELNLA
ncbi:MAG: Tab2/Atab2 family RNA-binding protein [Trichocoleus desertorum ATA4-8-CV12]|jgi:hypothetical protein|nr:Tab2/Atab2 family RNA-binding protein [Trichocoleus desertorum ATA4-8-CV12]